MEPTRNRRTDRTGAPRAGYHHGDLRNALIAAGTELARAGGPEKVVLREAARRVGVSATAAYRHFEGHGDLLHAVKHRAQDTLLTSMERSLAATEPLTDPGDEAERRLLALGRGYVAFAMAEPGLYRAAFQHEGLPPKTGEEPEARSYTLVSDVLDELVASRRLPVARRPLAEIVVWAPLHGLCMLVLDGSLAALDEAARSEAGERLMDTALRGLCGP